MGGILNFGFEDLGWSGGGLPGCEAKDCGWRGVSVDWCAMSSLSEAELIAGCRQGDPLAWDELFNRHYAAAARFVFQLSHEFTREDAEEICKEVFLSVIKNL